MRRSFFNVECNSKGVELGSGGSHLASADVNNVLFVLADLCGDVSVGEALLLLSIGESDTLRVRCHGWGDQVDWMPANGWPWVI